MTPMDTGCSRQRGQSPSRRSFLVAAGTLVSLLIGVPAAAAGEEWCEDDPVLTLRVRDRPVTVHVTFAVPVAQRRQLRRAWATGEVRGDTIVVRATVPDTAFKVWARLPARHIAVGNPAAVYPAGQIVTLTFPDVAAAEE